MLGLCTVFTDNLFSSMFTWWFKDKLSSYAGNDFHKYFVVMYAFLNIKPLNKCI